MLFDARVIDSDIAKRLTTANELAGRVSAAIYLLNNSETMTSQREVDAQRERTQWLQLLDELTRFQRDVSRVSDVTRTTRSHANSLQVSTHACAFLVLEASNCKIYSS